MPSGLLMAGLLIVSSKVRVGMSYTVTLLVPRFVTYRSSPEIARRVGELTLSVIVLSITPLVGFTSSTWFAPLFATHRLPELSNMMPFGLLSCALAVNARPSPSEIAQQRARTSCVDLCFISSLLFGLAARYLLLDFAARRFSALTANGAKRIEKPTTILDNWPTKSDETMWGGRPRPRRVSRPACSPTGCAGLSTRPLFPTETATKTRDPRRPFCAAPN